MTFYCYCLKGQDGHGKLETQSLKFLLIGSHFIVGVFSLLLEGFPLQYKTPWGDCVLI